MYVCVIATAWPRDTLTTRTSFFSRSLPKLSSQDEDGPNPHTQYTGVTHFEPIPHDHDFCERVVINVSIRNSILPPVMLLLLLLLALSLFLLLFGKVRGSSSCPREFLLKRLSSLRLNGAVMKCASRLIDERSIATEIRQICTLRSSLEGQNTVQWPQAPARFSGERSLRRFSLG